MKPGSRQPTEAGPAIDILVKCPLWKNERGIRTVLRRAIAEAASVTASEGELAIVLSDDAAIRALNRDWRRKDQPTNVLSFPAARQSPHAVGCDRPHCLGDIVIAYETAAREAKAEHKPLRHHVAHLAVHGFLHLVGYDHHAEKEAAAMEALETAVLARIGVPSPYIARVPPR
jgi:probable rRNA maturation factor